MAEGLKPFDLEKALAGEPVVTRDGRQVLWIGNTDLPIIFPVSVLVIGWEAPSSFLASGCFLADRSESNNDLFMAPKQRTAWVNVYKQEGGSLIAAAVPYTSEQAAKNAAAKSTMQLVKILPVEYEE